MENDEMNNAGYGSHPTRYGSLDDSQLYFLFREEHWGTMDEAGRRELLQESVNRAAMENGELGSCAVVFDDLPSCLAGRQSGDMIYLNRDMFVYGIRKTSYNGQICTVPLFGSNMRALETALHEDQHAYQNQVINGVIVPKDPALQYEYASNNFGIVQMKNPDGTLRNGCTYLQGLTPGAGYYLYYFQSSERDAHQLSEEKTVSIMNNLAAKYGEEASFSAYWQEVSVNGYQAMLAEAQKMFQCPFPEKEINQSLMNHYYGTQNQVAPQIEALVAGEMAASYAALAQQNELDMSQGTALPASGPDLDNSGTEGVNAGTNEGCEADMDLDDGLDM